MRRLILALTATAAAALACPTARAAADIPYYKLHYSRYDYTYESEVEKARRYASFYWDGKLYCRYRSGWNGPGAYESGDRFRRRYGWDGGYPWQGPGTPADHDDEASFEAARANYAREFRHAGECGSRRYRRHHVVVLRRKD